MKFSVKKSFKKLSLRKSKEKKKEQSIVDEPIADEIAATTPIKNVSETETHEDTDKSSDSVNSLSELPIAPTKPPHASEKEVVKPVPEPVTHELPKPTPPEPEPEPVVVEKKVEEKKEKRSRKKRISKKTASASDNKSKTEDEAKSSTCGWPSFTKDEAENNTKAVQEEPEDSEGNKCGGWPEFSNCMDESTNDKSTEIRTDNREATQEADDKCIGCGEIYNKDDTETNNAEAALCGNVLGNFNNDETADDTYKQSKQSSSKKYNTKDEELPETGPFCSCW